MMSLSEGYPQILASGYPDSKFTIRFSPTSSKLSKAIKRQYSTYVLADSLRE